MFHFFNYNLCSRELHTHSFSEEKKEKPENLLLNISEIVFMSLFSNVVQYWNRKSLNCCCRLGTFSQEKSCLIIFRHKYECILAGEWVREREKSNSEHKTFAKWWKKCTVWENFAFLHSCIFTSWTYPLRLINALIVWFRL